MDQQLNRQTSVLFINANEGYFSNFSYQKYYLGNDHTFAPYILVRRQASQIQIIWDRNNHNLSCVSRQIAFLHIIYQQHYVYIKECVDFLIAEKKALQATDKNMFRALLTQLTIPKYSAQALKGCFDDIKAYYKSNITQEPEEECSNKKDKKKFNKREISALSLCFRYQHRLEIILQQQSQIINFEELAEIYQWPKQQILDLYQKYKENVTSIFYEPVKQQYKTILLMIIIRIKLMILQYLQEEKFPSQKEIELAIMKIGLFEYKVEEIMDKSQIRMKLIEVYRPVQYFSKFSYKKRDQIARQLLLLSKIPLQRQQQQAHLLQISQKYNATEECIKKKYTEIKQEQGIYKKQQLMAEVGSIIAKINVKNIREVAQIVQKEGLQKKNTFLDSSSAQLNRRALEKRDKYFAVAFNKIETILQSQRQEVLFINFCIFYRKQFELYNINTGVQCKINSSMFDPVEDTLFYVIIGVTSSGTLLFEVVYEKIRTSFYIDIITSWMEQIKVPKMVVINLPNNLPVSDWERVVMLSAVIEKNQSKLMLLPIMKQIPNPCKLVEKYLKHNCLKVASPQIDQKNFTKKLGSFVIWLLSQMKPSIVKEYFFKQWIKTQKWIGAQQKKQSEITFAQGQSTKQ